MFLILSQIYDGKEKLYLNLPPKIDSSEEVGEYKQCYVSLTCTQFVLIISFFAMPLKCIYIDGMHKNTTAICDNDFFPSSEL
jgi:hypothetical protein